MKKVLFCVVALYLSACGYTSRENEVIGQVKKVMLNTPLVCPDYYDMDLSLGVVRNGTGSMSSQDGWFIITTDEQRKILKEANETGKIVKIIYDVKRYTFCTSDHFIRSVEFVNN